MYTPRGDLSNQIDKRRSRRCRSRVAAAALRQKPTADRRRRCGATRERLRQSTPVRSKATPRMVLVILRLSRRRRCCDDDEIFARVRRSRAMLGGPIMAPTGRKARGSRRPLFRLPLAARFISNTQFDPATTTTAVLLVVCPYRHRTSSQTVEEAPKRRTSVAPAASRRGSPSRVMPLRRMAHRLCHGRPRPKSSEHRAQKQSTRARCVDFPPTCVGCTV